MPSAMGPIEDRLYPLLHDAPGDWGVAIRHVERNERLALGGDKVFPTASVFKVPVLIEAFRRIGAGELRLDEQWTLTDEEKSRGSGVLQLLGPGLKLTTHDLLTLMITISDNTATDMIVRRLGAKRISATLRELGLKHTFVDCTCRELLANIYGPIPAGLPPHEQAAITKERGPNPKSSSYAGRHPNDVSTANEMTDLFTWLVTGERLDGIGIDAQAREVMLAILFRQQLNDRLPRFLPATLPFAHKTGSLSGAFEIRNDAGVLFLEDGSHVAMAVFSKVRLPEDPLPREVPDLRWQVDDAIAEIALSVYQHYHSQAPN